MNRMGFQPRTPVFERAKTVRASDLAATVNGPVGLGRESNSALLGFN